ncbi:MAG TPA: helix-turn-helix domain-containing protein [Chloroflexia bacterium]|nr:helix-turn-helix domain-containing protein [Chloroflexia bacterium]
MAQTSDKRMAELVKSMRQDPALPARLSGPEAAIVRAALDGQTVYEIAQDHGITEAAVWDLLSNAARAAAGTPLSVVETGAGLGSDEEPSDRD